MKPESKAEDFLAMLLWGLEKLMAPHPHKILESFQAWDYQNRLKPQFRLLERSRLLERQGTGNAQRYQLTEEGRLAAQGGKDLMQRWRRPWDGQWRMLLFDLPSNQPAARAKLWRWLKRQGLGYLQNSVWVTPDSLDTTILPIARKAFSAESFLIVESRPAIGHSNQAIVNGAWDFAAINRRYQACLTLLAEGESTASGAGSSSLARRRQWLARERDAWVEAVTGDPLLPEVLLPEGYLGQAAWQKRQTFMAKLAKPLSAGSDKTV